MRKDDNFTESETIIGTFFVVIDLYLISGVLSLISANLNVNGNWDARIYSHLIC